MPIDALCDDLQIIHSTVLRPDQYVLNLVSPLLFQNVFNAGANTTLIILHSVAL